MAIQRLPDEGYLETARIVSWRESTRLCIHPSPMLYSRLRLLLTAQRMRRVTLVRDASYAASRATATAQYRAHLSPETLARLDAINARLAEGQKLLCAIRTAKLMRQQDYRLINAPDELPF